MAETTSNYGGFANPQYGQPAPPSYQASYPQQPSVVVHQPVHTGVIVQHVPDNMGLAIFACLCCFWPLGLFAIFKANESQNAAARGDIQGAISSAKGARQFSLISIFIGIVLIIVLSVTLTLRH